MNAGTKMPIEKIAVALAAAAFLASMVAYLPGAVGELSPRGSAAIKTATAAGGAPDALAGEPRGVLRAMPTWRDPAAQSAGPGWVYELFTPPTVYYDRLAHSFSVAPPERAHDARNLPAVELMAVKQESSPIQLAGHFGAPGEWLVAFTSPARAETILARPGDRVEGSGLTLRSFEVRKVVTAQVDAQEAYEVAGIAILHDDETGEEVVLDSRDRLRTASSPSP